MADDDWIILQVVYHFPWLRLLQIHLTPLEGLLYGYLHITSSSGEIATFRIPSASPRRKANKR